MKRFVFTLILLLYAFTMAAPTARAEDTMFTTTRLNQVVSTAVVLLTPFGFDITGLVVPFFTQDSENAYVDYEPYHIYMKQYKEWNMPGDYQQNGKIIDWEEAIFRTSLYGAILHAEAPHGDNVTSPECVISQGLQKSSDIPYLNNLLEDLELIDGPRGLQPKEADANGNIDTRKPTKILNKMTSDECKIGTFNVPWNPIANTQVALSTFGAGSKIDAFMRDTIMIIVSRLIHHPDGSTSVESVKKPLMEGAKQRVILTKKTREPYQQMLCHAGSAPCPNKEIGKETEGLDKHGGFPAGFIADKLIKAQVPHAGVEDDVTVVGFPAGTFNNSDLVANHMKVGLAEASCMVTASGKSQDIAVMGGQQKTVPIKEYCRTDTTLSCTPDTYEQILQKLPTSTAAVCTKYADNLPISQSQCVGMMNEIFNIEIRNDPEWSGENYRCEPRSDSSATGPFQIIDETYDIVTCANENMADDLAACKTNKEQLSRCSTEDAVELAMRVLLHYSNCNDVATIGSSAELYTALCNYGTGVGVPLEHLGGKTYCEHIFDVVGIPKP